jgi:hypothetical protein
MISKNRQGVRREEGEALRGDTDGWKDSSNEFEVQIGSMDFAVQMTTVTPALG